MSNNSSKHNASNTDHNTDHNRSSHCSASSSSSDNDSCSSHSKSNNNQKNDGGDLNNNLRSHAGSSSASSSSSASAYSYDDYDRQQHEIRSHSLGQPFVSKRLASSSISATYKPGSEFYAKSLKIAQRFPRYRQIRSDGNCMYRSLAFSIFEQMAQRGEGHLVLLRDFVQSTLDVFLAAGFPSFAAEDMVDCVKDVIDQVLASKTDFVVAVEELFNQEGFSEYIVSWTRFVTSATLRSNADDFMPFLQEGFYAMADFCATEVEPMGKEGDHVQLSAFVQAVPCLKVHVEYLDGTPGQVNTYDFESINFREGFEGVSVNLMYRPGHYDLLDHAERLPHGSAIPT
eukprot:ANDGO_01388.mRNA.1 Ubiquitin thioesterase otubain-like